MEKSLGIKSAFYFCTRQGSLLRYALGVPDPFYDVRSSHFRNLFRDLTEDGIEIGLHSSYLAFRDQEIFFAERRLLQQCSGQEISGNRHHYWHLNPQDVESTLLLHEKVGFKYDLSLGHDRYIGWRRGSSWPFFPFQQAEKREIKTLQISTNWMDDQLFKYLRYNPGDRLATLQTLIDRTAKQGGCFVADIHNYVFDDAMYPNWRKTYFWVLKQITARREFWIATPEEVANHWITRYSSILAASIGLTAGQGGTS
jgi:hypothetical protein